MTKVSEKTVQAEQETKGRAFQNIEVSVPQGLGTKEGVIIEILASRTKNQLREIMKAYEEGKGAAKMVGWKPRNDLHLGSPIGKRSQAVLKGTQPEWKSSFGRSFEMSPTSAHVCQQ